MWRLASSLAQPAALANIPHFLFKYLHKSNTTEVSEVKQPIKPFMTVSPCQSRSAGFRHVYQCPAFHGIEPEGTVVTGTQCTSEANPAAVARSSHLSVGPSLLIQLLFSCTDADRLTTGTKRKAKLVTREEKQKRWSRGGRKSLRRLSHPRPSAIFGPLLFGGVDSIIVTVSQHFANIYLQSVGLFCCFMVTNISGEVL